METKAVAGRLILVAIAWLGFATPSTAGNEELPIQLFRWYEAMQKPDRAGLEAFLAPSAQIELKDIGITQTREEFLDSLDAWEDAIAGGTIDARLAGSAGELLMVEVCYRFPSNHQLNLEIFRLGENGFARIVQEKKAEDCSDF